MRRFASLSALVLSLWAGFASAGDWFRVVPPVEYGQIREAPARRGLFMRVQPQTWSAEAVKKRIRRPVEMQRYVCGVRYDAKRFAVFQERGRLLVEHDWSELGPPLPLSFEALNKSGKGVCLDRAYAAAVVLGEDGFPAYFLGVFSEERFHVDFLWRRGEDFHALNCGLDPEYGFALERLAERVGRGALGKKYKGFVVWEVDLNRVEEERRRLSEGGSLQALLEPGLPVSFTTVSSLRRGYGPEE